MRWAIVIISGIGIILVLFFWVIPCITRLAKGKKLQSNSDIAFTNVNSKHNFKYAIKRFISTNTLKIILIVEIPLSEVGKAIVGLGAKITLTDKETGQNYEFEYSISSLEPTFSVQIPSGLANKKFKVKVVTTWDFASCVGETVEEAEFEI